MNILHYSLGLPPYRTGGLTKFCVDLMGEQARQGHNVFLLWPGEMKIFNKDIKIKVRNSYEGILNYEIINPLPIPLDEGINDVEKFMGFGDKTVYKSFLERLIPDVIHIHTFMGLHMAFLEAAIELGIRTVFTTHDFFPICPKVTMYINGGVCSNIEDYARCSECNKSALPVNTIRILQSPLYRRMKNSYLLKELRRKHRQEYFGKEENQNVACSNNVMPYKRLRDYYKMMFQSVSFVHYNSAVTKENYDKFLGEHEGVIISITHSDISDKRKIREYCNEMLNITYLGQPNGAKGFYILKDALDELWKENKKFSLNIYFKMGIESPYVIENDRYSYSELEDIFLNTDLLIAPSVWFETFGFTVAEALSYGVPVLISQNVGAKDILPEGAGIVIKDIDAGKIKESIAQLDKEALKRMNSIINDEMKILTIDIMTRRIIEECYLV